jgi:outer membrane protein assembly factor BamB
MFYSPILKVDDILYIQGRDFILALDANSGSTLWKSNAMPAGRFDYYNGKIYQYAGVSGEAYIFCLNATDGSLIWYANQFSDGTSFYSFGDININKQNGLLYSSDLKYAFCIDLNKMPQ